MIEINDSDKEWIGIGYTIAAKRIVGKVIGSTDTDAAYKEALLWEIQEFTTRVEYEITKLCQKARQESACTH